MSVHTYKLYCSFTTYLFLYVSPCSTLPISEITSLPYLLKSNNYISSPKSSLQFLTIFWACLSNNYTTWYLFRYKSKAQITKLLGNWENSTIHSAWITPIIQRLRQITFLSFGSKMGPETGNGYLDCSSFNVRGSSSNWLYFESYNGNGYILECSLSSKSS